MSSTDNLAKRMIRVVERYLPAVLVVVLVGTTIFFIFAFPYLAYFYNFWGQGSNGSTYSDPFPIISVSMWMTFFFQCVIGVIAVIFGIVHLLSWIHRWAHSIGG